MVKFWSICRNTFLQTIRQPIYVVLLLATFGVLVLSLPLTGWTIGGSSEDYRESDQKMMENLGVGTLLVSGLLFAAFGASGALSREIDEKTALTVISKPVSRATFVLGKFGGVAAAVTVAFYLCSLVLLMTARHKVMPAVTDPYDVPVIVLGAGAAAVALLVAVLGNYFFGWPFTSAWVFASLICMSVAMGLIGFIGKEWKIVPFGQDLRPQLLVGMVLIFLGVMIFVAVAVAASTRTAPFLTLLICLAVFFLGWTHPRVFTQQAREIPLVRVLAWITPNMTFLDPQDPMTMGKDIPPRYVGLAAIYSVCYIAAILALGIALFQTRQLEAAGYSLTVSGVVALVAWLGRATSIGAAIAALVLVWLPAYHTASGLILSGGLLAGAVVTWLLWGFFARGARWSYWLILPLTVLATGWGLGGQLLPGPLKPILLGADRVAAFVAMAIGAAMLVVLLLPRTRRHFATAHRKASGAAPGG